MNRPACLSATTGSRPQSSGWPLTKAALLPLLISFAASIAIADEPLPVSIDPIPLESTSYDIARQQSLVLKASDDISSIAVSDPAVCSVIQDPNDPKRVMLVGGKHGNTHVTFWFVRPDQDPKTFEIRVRLSALQLLELQAFLNWQYPGATITLTNIPLTGKIQVTGRVTSYLTSDAIVSSLNGAGVSEQGVVNRISTVPSYVDLQSFLNAKYPKAKLSLTVVPVSGKLLVEGMATSSLQAAQILEMIVCEDIPEPNIVNHLRVASCGCCPPCRYRRR